MPRREFDASRAVCDVCGKVYQPGDDMYTVHSVYDETVRDRDVLVEFRHYSCHTRKRKELEASLDRFADVSKDARDALARLRKLGL